MSILESIVSHKREEAARRAALRPLDEVRASAMAQGTTRDFRAALLQPQGPRPAVIAEIKRRSPSKGTLRAVLDPAQVAAVYEQNGASALSVLVDSHFFGGSYADLSSARQAVTLPVLCKEFIVDAYQIYEAREAGADAVLLLASVLGETELRDFRGICTDLGMAALVEAHDSDEVRAAVRSGADIIGINNRDLRTFKVSLDTTRDLAPLIPEDVVIVSESGVKTQRDRLMLAGLGVHALLVGEGLIAQTDIAAATREICGLEALLPGKAAVA